MAKAPSTASAKTPRRETAKATSVVPPVADPAARIIEAAYLCFDRYGIEKTTMGDIAKSARILRPRLYKYFASKEAIVERISELEVLRANEELRRKLKRSPSFETTVTDALLLSTRIAHENHYVRRVLESLQTSRSADPKSPVHALSRKRWQPLLEKAAAAGELAPHLTIDEIVTWLMLSQMMLIVKVDAIKISDAALRRFIRYFVVKPLLETWSGPEPERKARVTAKAAA